MTPLPARSRPSDSFEAVGTVRQTGGHQPWTLDGDRIWIVESGRIDIFLVCEERGELTGPRTHLLRVEAGEAIFALAIAPRVAGLALQAVGSPVTTLRALDRSQFGQAAGDGRQQRETIGLIDAWIRGLCDAITRDVRPKDAMPLDAGTRVDVSAGRSVHAGDGVVWVRHRAGGSLLLGSRELAIAGDGAVPMAGRAWLEAREDCTLQLIDTAAAIDEDALWDGLARLQTLAVEAADSVVRRGAETERGRLAQKAMGTRATLFGAMSQIASILERQVGSSLLLRAHATGEVTPGDALWLTCKLVGDALRIPMRPVPSSQQTSHDRLGSIARASRFRTRRVALKQDWWRQDNGPLLGSMADDERPVALIPKSRGGYEVIDVINGTRRPVTRAVAATISPFAFTFYRSLGDTAPTGRDLIRFGLQGCRRDVAAVLLAGATGGVLALFPPMAIGMLFNTIIPGAQRDQLLQMTLILLACAVAGGMFQVTWGVALMRIDGRAGSAVQAAVWDRLLSLPLPFFRRYSAGDLASRAMGIDVMRQILTGTMLAALLAGVFSLFNFGLMFYYNRILAEWALGLIAVAIAAVVLVGYRQLKTYRVMMPLRTKASGLVLQFLTGISKLRVAGAEIHAYAMWSRLFSRSAGAALRTEIGRELVLGVSRGLSGAGVHGDLLSGHVLRGGGDDHADRRLHRVPHGAERLSDRDSDDGLGGDQHAGPGAVARTGRAHLPGDARGRPRQSRPWPAHRRDRDRSPRVPLSPRRAADRQRHLDLDPLGRVRRVRRSVRLRQIHAPAAPAPLRSRGKRRDLLRRPGDQRARRACGSPPDRRRAAERPADDGRHLFTNIVGSSTASLDDAWEAARMAGLDRGHQAAADGHAHGRQRRRRHAVRRSAPAAHDRPRDRRAAADPVLR